METNKKLIESGVYQRLVKLYTEEEVKAIVWEARIFYNANKHLPLSVIKNDFDRWFTQHKNGN